MVRSWKFCATIVIIAIAFEVFLAWTSLTIHKAGYVTRYQPLAPTDTAPPSPPDTERRALAILTRTMNSVSKIEGGFRPIEFNALRQWVKTHGVLCGGMAHLYHGYLDRAGIPNRIVHFASSSAPSANTHVTVEVALNEKWVLLDPTFHVRFWHNGQALSARDLMNLYYRHESNQIKAQFLGDVRYPARIEEYYINYFLLTQNLYYIEHTDLISHHLVDLIRSYGNIARSLSEPLIYFYQKSLYTLPDNVDISHEMVRQYDIATKLYLIASIMIPIFMIVIFLGSIILILTIRCKSYRSEE